MLLSSRCLSLLHLSLCLLLAHAAVDNSSQCPAPNITLPSSVTQTSYTVGVLAIRGFPAAYQEFNLTFGEYLNRKLRDVFHPKINFTMVPLDFTTLYTWVESKKVDFVYVNPSAYSCIESQYGASSLVTQKSIQKVGNNTYEFTLFGGVIFVRADRTDIKTIADLKDKSIAAASISGLGSGQAQFRVMVDNGLNYIQDPSQLVFTSNQGAVVNMVYKKVVDVGFVRTNQIELMESQGKTKKSYFRYLSPVNVYENGQPYPFESSTVLYPEWNVAALSHVHWLIQREVQRALLEMDQSELAAQAANIKGWIPTLSYMELRNMQEKLDFISKNPTTGQMECIRGTAMYDSITCPSGYFKQTEAEVAAGCAKLKLACPTDSSCTCKPCTKAFDVDVFQVNDTSAVSTSSDQTYLGCAKMTTCAVSQQRSKFKFSIIDNKKRDNMRFTYALHLTNNLVKGVANKTSTSYSYVIEEQINEKGQWLIEVFANDVQISESPLFIQIASRDCAAVYGSNSLRVATDAGDCVCNSRSFKSGSRCVDLAWFIPVIIFPLLLLIILAIIMWIRHQIRKQDSLWLVKPDELQYNNPVEILGRGTFGLVVQAEYRGTTVAVKRVIPPKKSKDRKKRMSTESMAHTSMSGSARNMTRGSVKGFSTGATGSVLGLSSGSQNGSSMEEDDMESGFLSFCAFKKDKHAELKANFVQEMRILSKLRHPCITTVMGAIIGDRNTEPMLIMECMDHGSLYDLLHNETMVIDGEMILPILRDIAQGVRFLHAADPLIVHGDLKAQNVLVDSKFRAKVADFGLSQKKQLGACGTPLWMAPELLRGGTNTPQTDVYAFGIVLAEVYSRKDPYEGEDTKMVLEEVADLNRPVDKRPAIPAACPSDVVSIMKDCWHKNPVFRPPFEEVERRLKALDAQHAGPLSVFAGYQHHKNDANGKSHEELLYDVFPRHIANALREGRKVEPERRDMVTIFFSDIVGFTTISSTLDPVKVSNMLDRLYSAFDRLSQTHGVFKVETIGDAYMAVTNLVEDQPFDHALRIARFAIGAIKAAQSTPVDLDDPSKGTVQIRVGFHCGPVVANVVGTRNLRYCLFGDTVNTASRMESNSEALKIHCSERAADVLKKQAAETEVHCVPRGSIQIKGKGEMKTFWVEERKISMTIMESAFEEIETTVTPSRLSIAALEGAVFSMDADLGFTQSA
mmetsp:Transcript_24363/g.54895  ORF Transcript_24363/g.54895 Transcript_24363/m.54895 type:complete len:1195 (-) Transcript_24363:108-3692(-)